MKKPTKKVAKADLPEFAITINIEGRIYQGGGDTALEALKSVPIPESDYISFGTVTISHGKNSKEMAFPTMQMKRLLNPYHQDILITDLASGW